jgi:hypothetical protein
MVTFNYKALLVVLAFAVVLALTDDVRLGIAAVVAAVIIELLTWAGPLGLFRSRKS